MTKAYAHAFPQLPMMEIPMAVSTKKIGTHSAVQSRMVDPADLILNPENERDYIATAPDNVSLRQSLVADGVLEFMRIYPDGVVSNGNRRLFNINILRDAGEWTHGDVPVIVVPRPASLIEEVLGRLNINEASQFSPLEQGRAFAKLRDAGMNNMDISKRSPFTSMHVGNMLTLHDASPAVHDAVRAGLASATFAVATIRKHGEQVLFDAIALAQSQGRDRASERHVDAIVAPPVPASVNSDEVEAEVAASTAPAVEAEAESDTLAPPVGATEGEAEAEVEAEAALEVDLGDEGPPFDVDGTHPERPTPTSETEIPAPGGESDAEPDASRLTPKALLGLFALMLENLADAANRGTRQEKLDAMDESKEELESMVSHLKTLGIIKPIV